MHSRIPYFLDEKKAIFFAFLFITSFFVPPQTSPISIFALVVPVQNHSLLMADWAPVLVGVVLYVLLQPGLLFQFPGNNRQLEFGSMKTNGKAIAVHTLMFFTFYAILILAVHVHIYTG